MTIINFSVTVLCRDTFGECVDKSFVETTLQSLYENCPKKIEKINMQINKTM